MNARETCINQALDLAAKGYYLFPVKRGEKRPMHSGWQADSTTDPKAIRQWPDTDRFGIDCGKSRLVVIDQDPTKGGEIATLPVALDGPTVQTPRGGTHTYFRNDGPTVRLSAGKIAEGVDVRADGGLVVGPGSEGYSGTLPRIGDLPALPQGVRNLLDRPREPEDWRPGTPLAELLKNPPAEGGRNDWLAKVAGHYANEFGTWPNFYAVLKFTNEQLVTPLGVAEVFKVAESIWGKESQQATERRDAFESFDVSGWLATDHPAPKRLGQGRILYEGGLHTLVGEPESGKSVLAYQWMIDVMRSGGRCVLLDEEAGPYDAMGKLQALGLTRDLAQHLTYLQPRGRNLDRLANEFHEVVGHDCKMLVVDSMAAVLATAGKEENSNADVTEFVNKVLLPLAKGRGVAVVVIDHKTKGTTGERYSRGASAKLGIVDMSIEVEATTPFSRDQDGLLKLTCHKDRFGYTGRGFTWQAKVGTTGGLHLEIGRWGEEGARAAMGALAGAERKQDADRRARVFEFVRENPGTSRRQIAAHLGGRKQIILDTVRAMIEDEILRVDGNELFVALADDNGGEQGSMVPGGSGTIGNHG